MSDEAPRVRGPVMLVATNMMRPPPTRIGKIGKDFVLPRTIPVLSLIGGVIGSIFGLMIGLLFGSFQGILMGILFGAALGVGAVTLSPIKGESLGKWLGLSAASMRAAKVEIDGEAAKVFIGIAPLAYTAAGRVQMMGGAVNVVEGTVDERGVIIPHSEVTARQRVMAQNITSSRGGDWAPRGEVKTLPTQAPASLGGKPAKVTVKADKKPKETRQAPQAAPQVPQQRSAEAQAPAASSKPKKLPVSKPTKLKR